MADVDVAKFLRLEGAIRAALESVPDGQASLAGEAMAERYMGLRSEVKRLIPKDDVEEFERLFPTALTTLMGPASPAAQRAGQFNAARSRLGSLAGWLEGYIRHARLREEAEAYAREKVRQERGIGFHHEAS